MFPEIAKSRAMINIHTQKIHVTCTNMHILSRHDMLSDVVMFSNKYMYLLIRFAKVLTCLIDFTFFFPIGKPQIKILANLYLPCHYGEGKMAWSYWQLDLGRTFNTLPMES